MGTEAYELDDSSLDRVFDQQIAPVLFAGVAAGEHPLLILVGAQPGAGKTRAGRDAAAEATSTVVRIIGDDLRQFHPDFEELLNRNPAAMPDATAQASAAWVRRSIAYAMERRISILVEGTFRDSKVPVAEARKLSAAGYAVHVVVLAVPAHVSRASIAARYAHDAATKGEARFTSVAAHDNAFAALVGTIGVLADRRARVGRLRIVGRDGERLTMFGHPSTGIPRAVQVFRREQAKPLDTDAHAAWIDDITLALRHFTDNDAEAPEVQALITSLLDDLREHGLTWVPDDDAHSEGTVQPLPG